MQLASLKLLPAEGHTKHTIFPRDEDVLAAKSVTAGSRFPHDPACEMRRHHVAELRATLARVSGDMVRF
ncbi:MAG: hypothetical protein CMJ81_13740 [Planctomycetaceae bacterium]|nr:hypothetical protein [Planctomycetaceae bacterium]